MTEKEADLQNLADAEKYCSNDEQIPKKRNVTRLVTLDSEIKSKIVDFIDEELKLKGK